MCSTYGSRRQVWVHVGQLRRRPRSTLTCPACLESLRCSTGSSTGRIGSGPRGCRGGRPRRSPSAPPAGPARAPVRSTASRHRPSGCSRRRRACWSGRRILPRGHAAGPRATRLKMACRAIWRGQVQQRAERGAIWLTRAALASARPECKDRRWCRRHMRREPRSRGRRRDRPRTSGLGQGQLRSRAGRPGPRPTA